MARQYDRKLILENGSEFFGYGFGANTDRVCELCFNTSMVGYQEIVSSPSNTDMAVVMTYPLIGNYGITDEDFESRTPTLGALIVSEYNDLPSNFRCTKTLAEILEENNIPAIEGLDTRKLTRMIRDGAASRALLTGIDTTAEEGMRILAETPAPENVIARVSCRKRWFSRTPDHLYNVVAVDCGIKLSTIRQLNARDCNVTVVPWNTDVETVLAMKPDGIFISNGPGNPEDAAPVIELVKVLRGKLPIFGICLGHQIISLAYGAKTYRLSGGHHGGYPVRNLETGKLESTSQSHFYAVDAASLEGTGLEVTHVNVSDNTVEGVACKADRVFSVQYHPESAPGPQDSAYLFDQFIALMKEAKRNA